MSLPQIMVAPNGARKGKADHPQVPLTLAETVDCAIACHRAGAGGLHAHIRDADGHHLLDATGYRALLDALHQAVPDMALQITTEAAGRYAPDVQMKVALEVGADLVSASIRELCVADHATVRDFIATCAAQEISLQYILYSPDDCALLAEVPDGAALRDPALQLLFVLGRYSETPARPEDLDPFMDWMSKIGITPDWMVCAFGAHEVDCLVHAARQGGKCRVGFENSLHLSDGSIAPDNAAKVADLAAQLRAAGL